MSPPAKLHKPAVKVVHAFCLCARAHHVTPPLLLVYLGELWCQLKKKKEGSKETFLTWLESQLQIAVCSPNSVLLDVLYQSSWTAPVLFDRFHLLLWDTDTPCHEVGGSSVLAGCAESFNSNQFSHCRAEHDKSTTSAAFQSRRCFGTFCAWFTCDLLRWGVSAVGEATVDSPALCTFTWMCLGLCRRDQTLTHRLLGSQGRV